MPILRPGDFVTYLRARVIRGSSGEPAVNPQAAISECESFAWERKVRATARESGGSMPIAAISLGRGAARDSSSTTRRDRIRALRGRGASRYRGDDHGTVFIRRPDRKSGKSGTADECCATGTGACGTICQNSGSWPKKIRAPLCNPAVACPARARVGATTGGYFYHQPPRAPNPIAADLRAQEGLLAECGRISGILLNCPRCQALGSIVCIAERSAPERGTVRRNGAHEERRSSAIPGHWSDRSRFSLRVTSAPRAAREDRNPIPATPQRASFIA